MARKKRDPKVGTGKKPKCKKNSNLDSWRTKSKSYG